MLQENTLGKPGATRTMRLLKIIPALIFVAVQASADPLRRGLGPEPDSFDIHQAQGLSAIHILRETREGLLTFDDRGELTAGVAESWTVASDGKEYRFLLREDARWSNGDPVVADDFVRAWQSAMSPQSAARTAGLMDMLSNARRVLEGHADPSALGVRAESSRLLLVELEHPAPRFMEILAHPVSFPLHPETGQSPLDSPVNGAYQVTETVPHAMIRLQRNPEFHARDSVALETVEFLPIEDPAAELSRYRAGEIDITETIPAGRYQWLQQNLPADLRVSPYLGSFWLGFNLGKAPFSNNASLRRALVLAIDRETLVRVVLGAGETPAWSVVPPGLSGYTPQRDSAIKLDRQGREAEARNLFATAGYGPARPLRVELRFNTSSQHRRLAVVVAAMWKQVLGVETELINEEWKVFVNNRRQGVLTQVFRGGWIADYADPASFLDLFRSGDELNTTFYINEQYDQLMAQAASFSGSQRMELLQQAETLLMRDMPVIPLYYYVSRHLVNPRVRGFHDNVRDIHLSRYLGLDTGIDASL